MIVSRGKRRISAAESTMPPNLTPSDLPTPSHDATGAEMSRRVTSAASLPRLPLASE